MSSIKYTVEFSNTMEELDKAGYQMPEHTPFTTVSESMDFIDAEVKKAHALLQGFGKSEDYRFYKGTASQTIRSEYSGDCHWEIIETDEKGNRLVPTAFLPDEYVQKTYGITNDGLYGVREGMEIPYHGILLARNVEGEFKSYWEKDAGLPFEETLAKKLIDDPEVRLGTYFGYVSNEDDTDMVPATDYYLPCTNPDSVIFKPTVHAPVSDADNVDTDFVLEVLFTFDDGYVVPVMKAFKTGGPHSISVADAIRDVIGDLDGSMDDVKEFFEGCGNYEACEGGFNLVGFTRDGLHCEMEFCKENLGEVCRALTSVRLVDMSRRISEERSY